MSYLNKIWYYKHVLWIILQLLVGQEGFIMKNEAIRLLKAGLIFSISTSIGYVIGDTIQQTHKKL